MGQIRKARVGYSQGNWEASFHEILDFKPKILEK
jgi:hypothetical protein